jgi:hypothetical protein
MLLNMAADTTQSLFNTRSIAFHKRKRRLDTFPNAHGRGSEPAGLPVG